MRRPWALLELLVDALAAAPAAQADPLQAEVGKADITPRTGYYLGGWTSQDRVAQGQHTRLWARALVVQRGDRKVALVAVDLFMVPGGLVKRLTPRVGAQPASTAAVKGGKTRPRRGPCGLNRDIRG